MKKILKQSITIILVLIAIFSISSVTIATTIEDLNKSASGEFIKVGNAAVKVLTTIGMVASVVTLVIIGIKYMMGSVEERATYKKSLMPYFIGGILVFGASSIASIVYNIAKNL